MKRNLSLLKPELETVILSDDTSSEKVTYLKVPHGLGKKELKKDIKSGAGQFEEIISVVEKENEPTYILITAENIEQGYMAVTYMASCFNEKKHLYSEEIDDETENENDRVISEYFESPYKIPVIEENALHNSIYEMNNPFSMQNTFMQGNQSGIRKKPYWFECRCNAVCIVSRAYNMNIFGGYSENEDALYDSLGIFKNNDKIYILNIEEKRDWEYDFDDDYEKDEKVRINERGKWNYIVLSFAADEIVVKLSANKEKDYYKQILRGVLYKKGIEISKGFNLQRISNLVVQMKKKEKCKLMENIVDYAIKDWSADKRCICNQDFDFMDRFIRIEESKTIKKAKDDMISNLVGMKDVKDKVIGIVNVMKFNKLREEMKIGGGKYHNVHMMIGAPGTAKTTVAKLMGQMMVEQKLLPDNRFVCVNGAELKGMYVGHSAPKTKALFENNDIIVIDEAYSLVGDDGNCDMFSKEAIAQLIIELENHSMDKLIIFAGYGGKDVSERNNKMKAFLDSNPGIKSRITSTIYFDSYKANEMVDIFFKIADNQGYIVDESAKGMLEEYFEERRMDDNFGNGREARSLLETAVVHMANRVFALDKKNYSKYEMQHITYNDVENALDALKMDYCNMRTKKDKVFGFTI